MRLESHCTALVDWYRLSSVMLFCASSPWIDSHIVICATIKLNDHSNCVCLCEGKCYSLQSKLKRTGQGSVKLSLWKGGFFENLSQTFRPALKQSSISKYLWNLRGNCTLCIYMALSYSLIVMDPKCTKKSQLEKLCRSSITSSTGVATESICSSLKIRLWDIRAKCDNSCKWWWLSLCSIEGEEKHMDTSQVHIN